MSDLRREETEVRDYVITELEKSRAQQDSNRNAIKIAEENLMECENQFMHVAGNLNEKLARCEVMYENLLKSKIEQENDIQRLTEIIESYIQSDIDRRRKGGGFIYIYILS